MMESPAIKVPGKLPIEVSSDGTVIQAPFGWRDRQQFIEPTLGQSVNVEGPNIPRAIFVVDILRDLLRYTHD